MAHTFSHQSDEVHTELSCDGNILRKYGSEKYDNIWKSWMDSKINTLNFAFFGDQFKYHIFNWITKPLFGFTIFYSMPNGPIQWTEILRWRSTKILLFATCIYFKMATSESLLSHVLLRCSKKISLPKYENKKYQIVYSQKPSFYTLFDQNDLKFPLDSSLNKTIYSDNWKK